MRDSVGFFSSKSFQIHILKSNLFKIKFILSNHDSDDLITVTDYDEFGEPFDKNLDKVSFL